MGVACQILIFRAGEGVYYAGKTVTGIVKYVIPKPTEYYAVTLSLLGIGKCKWSESDADGGSSFYRGSETYIDVHTNLLRSQHPVILQSGSYEHPFEFHLPENIPSSFKNAQCTIRYCIEIKFIKNNLFRFNKKFCAEIPVYGFVEPTVEGPMLFGLDKTLFKPFSIKNHLITMKGVLPKVCLCPGESAQLNLRVDNNTSEKPTVHVDLYCYTILTANSKNTMKTRDKIKGCFVVTNAIRKHSVVDIALTIPTRGDLYTIDCKVMKKLYVLQVQLKLPAPHKNPVVEVPIVIGERRGMVMTVKDVPFWQLMSEDVEKD